MCGIACIFHPSQKESSYEGVLRMLRTMHSRGPDGSGIAEVQHGHMGHCRLAVIDTSAQAAQPMQRNGVTLCYNGECYSFQEERDLLAKQGYTFSTSSDTEVVLALYLTYGSSFVHRLRGMFAFVLFDSRTDTIIAARDPLGIKPLFYSTTNGLTFSSTLRGMLAAQRFTPSLNQHALQRLLAFGCVKQPSTILTHVTSLMPGQMLVAANGNVTLSTFWTPHIPPKFSGSYQDAQEACRALLTESINLQRVSDVPLGAFLSSGIDSALLAALYQKHIGTITTLSVGFEDNLATGYYDESTEAEALARHIGTQHKTVIITQKEIAQQLPKIAAGLDHPSVDGVNSWVVSRAAAESVTVALSGTGGDELFAGYLWFQGLNGRPVQQSALAGAQKDIPDPLAGEPQHMDPLMARIYRFLCFRPPADVYRLCPHASAQPLLLDDPLPNASPVDRMTGLTLHSFARDQLLPDIDTASMAHSLEVRVPFLDTQLVQFALSLPDDFRLGSGVTTAPAGSYAATGVKRILLDMAADLLPAGFASRPKRGFTLPFDGWLRGELHPLCQDIFSASYVKQRNWTDPQETANEWHAFLEGKISWYRIWILLMLELWGQEVYDARHGLSE